MATTRKKIAEQVLRVINGGNVSDDSRVDIREVMVLVDQERDLLIKKEILDRFYTKSTSTVQAELEITGDFLTSESLSVTTNDTATMTNTPISLPNDMGVFKVYYEPASTVQVETLTVTTGVTAGNTTPDIWEIEFRTSYRELDSKYKFSFTLNDGNESHDLVFNIYTEGYADSFYNTINISDAIVNNDDFKSFLNDFDLKTVARDGGDTSGVIGISGLYDFTISNVLLNEEGSLGSHGFHILLTETSVFAQTNISDSTLAVNINGDQYMLSYSEEEYVGGVSTANVAINFVQKFANQIFREHNIILSHGAASTVVFSQNWGAKEFDISVSTPGEIQASIVQTTAPDLSFNNDEYIEFLRMPAHGANNPLYNRTVLRSGKDFFYIEGNKIKLYKNAKIITSINVLYIATSDSISDTAAYPIPADYEGVIVRNLIDVFTLMVGAKEDYKNDNIGG